MPMIDADGCLLNVSVEGRDGGPTLMLSNFGRDVLAILDDLNIEKVHWCGLSMGGMVGQWLGANAPQRFGKIILSNTSCYYPDPTNWLNRIKAVKQGGIASVADAVIAGWLTADFREREPQITAHLDTDRITKLFEPMAYQGVSQALIDRLLASLDDK